MLTISLSNEIIKAILKSPSSKHTITSLSNNFKASRVGIWKALKDLETDELIILEPLGSGKTSTYLIKLNWRNVLLEKMLSLALTKEAIGQQRWRSNFAELEKETDFIILYGSILHSPKEANDIDVLSVVSNKRGFIRVSNILDNVQKTQIKKVHAINFTSEELEYEINKPNKAFIDALKKGIILYGQENFIRFIKEGKWR